MHLIQVAQKAVDLDRAVSFYRDLLGQDAAATFDPPGLAFFVLDEVRLLLDRGAPSSLIYLRVDDVQETVDRMRATGVEVIGDPQVIFRHADDTIGPAGTDEWMAFIRDSEGNTVGLVAHLPAPAL